MSETETIKVIERPKPSKLQRIKSAATHVGVYAIPAAVVGGSMYFTWKIFDMQLETAQLYLEAAKLKEQSE